MKAKGLLIQAIRDDDPVIFFEHKAMYDTEMEVPDEPYAIPFGQANVTREGDDVTIVAFGRMVNFANEAADSLAKKGISCTVVDPRTTHRSTRKRSWKPWRRPGGSSSSTRRIRAAAWRPTSPAWSRSAPSARSRRPSSWLPRPHAPVPFSPALEDLYIPGVAKIEAAVREIMDYGVKAAAE
jgi:pyruvate dehydrogenase E1 component beta subunit